MEEQFEYNEFLNSTSSKFSFIFDRKVNIDDIRGQLSINITEYNQCLYVYMVLKNATYSNTHSTELYELFIRQCMKLFQSAFDLSEILGDVIDVKAEASSNLALKNAFLECMIFTMENESLVVKNYDGHIDKMASKMSYEFLQGALIESDEDMSNLKIDLIMLSLKIIGVSVTQRYESKANTSTKPCSSAKVRVVRTEFMNKDLLCENNSYTDSDDKSGEFANLELYMFVRPYIEEMIQILKNPSYIENDAVWILKTCINIESLVFSRSKNEDYFSLFHELCISENNLYNLYSQIIAIASRNTAYMNKIVYSIFTSDKLDLFKTENKDKIIIALKNLIKPQKSTPVIRKIFNILMDSKSTERISNFLKLVSCVKFNREAISAINAIFFKLILRHKTYSTLLLYSNFILLNKAEVPINDFLQQISFTFVRDFYASLFRKIHKTEDENPHVDKIIIGFLKLFLATKNDELLGIIQMVPYIPSNRDACHLVYELYVMLFEKDSPDHMVEHLGFFLQRTPALTGIASSLYSNVKLIPMLATKIGIPNCNPQKVIFLAIMYYCESRKLQNFNYSGIMEYINDEDTIRTCTSELPIIIHGIHQNYVSRSYDFTFEYTKTLMNIALNSDALETSLLLVFVILKHLFVAEPRLLFAKKLHTDFKSLFLVLKNRSFLCKAVITSYTNLYNDVLESIRCSPNFYNYIILCFADVSFFNHDVCKNRNETFNEFYTNVVNRMRIIDEFPDIFLRNGNPNNIFGLQSNDSCVGEELSEYDLFSQNEPSANYDGVGSFAVDSRKPPSLNAPEISAIKQLSLHNKGPGKQLQTRSLTMPSSRNQKVLDIITKDNVHANDSKNVSLIDAQGQFRQDKKLVKQGGCPDSHAVNTPIVTVDETILPKPFLDINVSNKEKNCCKGSVSIYSKSGIGFNSSTVSLVSENSNASSSSFMTYLVDIDVLNRSIRETQSSILWIIDVIYTRRSESSTMRTALDLVKHRLRENFQYEDLYVLLKIYNILGIREKDINDFLLQALSKGLDFKTDSQVCYNLSLETSGFYKFFFRNLYTMISNNYTVSIPFPSKEELVPNFSTPYLILLQNTYKRSILSRLILRTETPKYRFYFLDINRLGIVDALIIAKRFESSEIVNIALEFLRSSVRDNKVLVGKDLNKSDNKVKHAQARKLPDSVTPIHDEMRSSLGEHGSFDIASRQVTLQNGNTNGFLDVRRSIQQEERINNKDSTASPSRDALRSNLDGICKHVKEDSIGINGSLKAAKDSLDTSTFFGIAGVKAKIEHEPGKELLEDEIDATFGDRNKHFLSLSSQSLIAISSSSSKQDTVRSEALSHITKDLIFYVPQLIQTLRNSKTCNAVLETLLVLASDDFVCHQMIWNLKANLYKDELKLCKDPCYDMFMSCITKIMDNMSESSKSFYNSEISFLNSLTEISSSLLPFLRSTKEEKTRQINSYLSKIQVPKDVYLPHCPEYIVESIVPNSGRALQSHAKVPFLVSFIVKDSNSIKCAKQVIFKFGDDCRQDMLALQLISMFKHIFEEANLDIYLYPYKVVATDVGCGVIEVIPNSKSRDQIGREKINNLREYFEYKFGYRETQRYIKALNNFVSSLAGYSLVAYFLNVKDRHNGNIMIDNQGRMIHIDFGYMFEISPGNLNIEVPLKLTKEIDELLGGPEGNAFKSYEELMVKGFFALRRRSKDLVMLVDLFMESGLNCFRKNAVENFIERFKFELDDFEAAQFTLGLIAGSTQRFRTWMYDQYQKVTNNIAF